MAAKKIFNKKNCIESMEKSGKNNNEIEMPNTSSFSSDSTTKLPAVSRNFGTDSPPPPEPFTNNTTTTVIDRCGSPIDLQLLEMLKKNYDLISLITDIEREKNEAPGLNHQTPNNLRWQEQQHRRLLSPDIPNSYLRHRAQSIAVVPSIEIKDTNLSPPSSSSQSSSSMLEEDEEDNIIMTQRSFCENLRGQWSDFYGHVTDALSETNDDIKARKSPEPQQKLSPHALKRDIKRCLSELQPYIETLSGLRELFIWRTPIASLCTFFVYIFCVYRGWAAALFFFIILFQLILNYFAEHKGINLGLNFLPRKEVNFKRVDSSGAQLVFDVARKTQIVLTIIADIFEKLKNLFTWKKPKVTFKFFMIVFTFFCISVFCSTSTFLIVIGSLFGGKAFIMTYLYHRFPRLQRLFDIAIYFYDRLPTSRTTESPILPKTSGCSLNLIKTNWKNISNDALAKSQSTNNILNPVTEDIRRKSIGVIPYQTTSASCALATSSSSPHPTITHASETQSNMDASEFNDDIISASDDDSLSVDIFMITRSCVFIDKDRPFPFGMSSGTLMLNDKMLRFRRQKLKEGIRETIQIPFGDIVSVKKIRTLKSFSLMPGSSKALEIKLSTKRKPIQFVGIPKRDEFYESLVETARISGVELVLNDDENC